MERKYEVFISHAGEDKDSLAVPIYNDLRRRGIRVFLDRPELRIGEDASEEMTRAMKTALIGLFILSPEFAAKLWTMKELFCFEERAKQPDGGESWSGTARPVLIPVFYRLTVAEARHRLVFKNYPDVCVRHGFMDRLDKKETDVTKVLDALSSLTRRTGIECDAGRACAEGSSHLSERRGRLVVRICDKVAKVLEDKFSTGRIAGVGSDGTACDMFRPTFYAPENADEVLLDFGEVMTDGIPRSREAQALREVLQVENEGASEKIVIIKGNAGVGKSCILRGIARETEVERRFPGGAYFVSLGMDATVETLISELLKIGRISGGHRFAKELKDEKSLDVVLERVGRWMKGKRFLMLVDDLWDRSKLGGAIVPRLAGVLSAGSGSVMVITTRFDSVAAKGKVVNIEPWHAMSEEAQNILLKYAGFSAEELKRNGAVRCIFDKMLRMCGGLPVCLAVMGCGLKKLTLALGSRGLKVWERYCKMMEEGERLIQAEVDDYKDLRTTLSVSLKVLEEGQSKYERKCRELSWAEMHRSFCIMKKQEAVNVQVFTRMWAFENEYDALEVLQAFAGVGLMTIKVGMDDGKTYLRLHDLIHDFSALCARSEREESKWHGRVLDGYIRREGESGVREWWNVEDDGYIFENVCRHLMMSGNLDELIELLLRRQWTEVRLEHGGLRAWIKDFAECFECIERNVKRGSDKKERLKRGLQLVRDAVAGSWTFVVDNRCELGFQVNARLNGYEESCVRKFLESVWEGEKKPHARALGRCWERPGDVGKGGKFVFSTRVHAIAVHGERPLAVAGVGSDVVFLEMEEMRVIRTCSKHGRDVVSVALSVHKSRVLSLSDDGVVREWCAENGEEVRGVVLKDIARNESNTRNAFSSATICPDGNIVVIGSDGGLIEVWDLESGERRGEAMTGCEGRVTFVSASRDGCRIASDGGDGNLCVWDVSRGLQVKGVLKGHERGVRCAAFSADSRFVASGSDDRTVRVWDVEEGAQRGDPMRGHEGWVWCISFSGDGRLIVSGGYDRTIRIWDAATGAQVGRSLCGHSNFVRCVSMTHDAQFVVSSGWDRTVRLWDLAAASGDAEERPRDHRRGYCLDVSVDGRWLVSGSSDGTVHMYDGSSGEQVGEALHAHDSAVSCISVSPCSRRFVSGSWDTTLRVWQFETGSQVGEAMRGHTNWVNCVAYSPNGLFIVSGSNDLTVRVWSAATHLQIGAAIGGGTPATVRRRPSGLKDVARGLIACVRGRGKCGDESGDESRNVHTDEVRIVKVSGSSRRIVCGLQDGRLYVWDVLSRKLVGAPRSEHDGRIERLDIFPGNLLRSVDWENVEMRWRLDDQHGLVRVPLENDDMQEGVEGIGSMGWSEQANVECVGRDVRVRGGVRLATLPAKVRIGRWRYNEASGALGIVLEDDRVLLLHVER